MSLARPPTLKYKLPRVLHHQSTAMSASGDHNSDESHKRPLEDLSGPNDDAKKLKKEPSDSMPENDDQFNDLFEDPIFNQNGLNTAPDDANAGGNDIELPDFLDDSKPGTLQITGNTNTESKPTNHNSVAQAYTAPVTAAHSNQPSKLPTPITSQRPSSAGPLGSLNSPSNQANDVLNPIQTPSVAQQSPASNTSGLPSAQTGLSQSSSTSSLPQTTLYQTLSNYPYLTYNKGNILQYPTQNRQTPTSAYKPGTRFDPRRTYPAPTGMGASYSTSSVPVNYSGGSSLPGSTAPVKEDPDQYKDAIHAAGVDILREEELLSTNYNRGPLSIQQQQLANRQRQLYGLANAFIQPYHVGLFMNRVARENGVFQNFLADPEMLEFMSAACKEWLLNIVTKTVILARHRRRGIPALVQSRGNQKLKLPPSQRSEVSKELRNIALRHKEQEEARVAKRLALGIENKDEVAPETSNKSGAEETLHRAANATAAMMTGGSSARKKYSWMKAGANGSGDDGKQGAGKDGGAKQSSLLASRGDNGLRYREIRTGNMVTTKDLLGVLEDERVGTSKAVVKGYAKLKD